MSFGIIFFNAVDPGIVPASGGGTVNYLRADQTWHAPPGTPTPPPNPNANAISNGITGAGSTTTNSTLAGVMAGQRLTFTPTKTGKMLLMVTGIMGFPGVGGGGSGNVSGRYGTGTPPIAGAPGTGTQFPGATAISPGQVLPGGNQNLKFTYWIAANLVVGTTYWLDNSFSVVFGTAASVTINTSLFALELDT